MNSPVPNVLAVEHKQIFVHDPRDHEERLDIVEYWRSVNKRKWAILGLGAVVALLAAAIVYVMTPIYRSTATVLIEASKSKVLSIEEIYSGISQNREYFQTQVEIIKSREVATKTIAKLKLWEHPEFDPREAGGMVAGFLEAVGFSDKPKEWDDETLTKAVYRKFEKRLTVEPIRLSQLAKISFESADKELAAKVANTLADEYIGNDLEARYKMTQQASNWLQDRLGSLRQKLDASERALQAYRERQGIVDVKSATQSGAGKQIEDVTQKLVEARMRRAEAENAYTQIQGMKPGSDYSSIPAVVRNSTVADARRQELDAERKLAELAQRYGKEHPKIVQAEGDLKAARDNVKRQIDTIVASVTHEYEVAKGTERALEQTLAMARGSVQNLNRKEFELGVLEREVQSNRQLYDMFMSRAKETNVAGDLQTTVARVVDPAVVTSTPVKPQKLQIILIAFVLGMFGGVLASLLLDRLDNTLKTSEDVEAKIKQPLLTALPLLKDSDRSDASRLFITDPDSLYSEAIRTARTGVLLSAIDLPNRVLLVTSSVPGEGKTTFSINLALAHAHTKKTLLVDADMRRPAVAKSLGIDQGAKGLSNLVSGTADLSDCVRQVPDSNLAVLPSGTIPPNPLELLLSQKFKETLERLAEEYDIVVIDSPPVELVSDALVIAPQVTSVIYMAKALDTPYQLVRKGINRLKRAEASVLGVALSHLDFEKAEKYYGEYSGYGKYGYGKHGYYGKTYGRTYGAKA